MSSLLSSVSRWFVSRGVRALLVLACTLAAPASASSREADSAEYQVKAAFLIHFTRLTEWPAPAPDARSGPFVVCVLGDSPIVPALDGMAAPVKGRPMSVRRLSKAIDSGACQVLFISGRASGELEGLVKSLPPGVLTVSEIDTNKQVPAVINFVLDDDNNVGFDVSLEAATRAHLDVSARLLNVARGVDGRKRRKD